MLLIQIEISRSSGKNSGLWVRKVGFYYVVFNYLKSWVILTKQFKASLNLGFLQLKTWVKPAPGEEGSREWDGWVSSRTQWTLLFIRSVVSDSLLPHGPQHSRFPCPSPSPWACSDSSSCHPVVSFSGHELGQRAGDSERQGALVGCSPWGLKELDIT